MNDQTPYNPHDSEPAATGKGSALKRTLTVLWHPRNRPGVVWGMIGLVGMGSIVLAGDVLFSRGGKSSDDPGYNVINTEAPASDLPETQVTAGSSELYKKAIEQQNQRMYQKALADEYGAAIPIPIPEAPSTADGGDIETCGCRISDEVLLSQLQRLGVGGGATQPRRIASSDIYIAGSGQLVGPDLQPLLWLDDPLYVSNQNGQLVSETRQPISDDDGQTLYLGREGELRRKDSVVVQLRGRLTTDEGVIFGSDGVLVTRSGGLAHIEACDIYYTPEQQIATVDGKGALFAGQSVHWDSNGGLQFYDGTAVLFQGQPLILTYSGEFLDPDQRPITSPAVLASRNGTAIGGDCKLRGTIQSTERLGASDLYLTPSRELVNASGEAITRRDVPTLLAPNGELLFQNGNGVNTPTGDLVQIGSDGRLTARDGDVLRLDGLLLFPDAVALGVNGKRVDGALEQVGSSDIYLTETGLLTDEKGRPLRHKSLRVGLGAERQLFSSDGDPVLDAGGQPVYLNADGQLVDNAGQLLAQDGLLLSHDGRAYLSSGAVLGDAGVEAMLSEAGLPLYVNGKRVFRTRDGRLVYADGSPVIDQNGRAVYFRDGQLVTEDGSPAAGGTLTDSNGVPVDPRTVRTEAISGAGQIGRSDLHRTASGLLVDKDGKVVSFRGKPVRLGSNGELLDENGNPILDAAGNPVYLNENGEIVDASGRPIDEALLTTADGRVVGADGKMLGRGDGGRLGDADVRESKNGVLLGEDGKPIMYNGKPVIRLPNGQLVTIDGEPVLDENGNQVLMTESGELVNSNGDPVTTGILTTSAGVALDSSGQEISRGGKLEQIPGTSLYRSADGVVFGPDGIRREIDGRDLRIAGDGKLQTPFGRDVRIDGDVVQVGEGGQLVNRDNAPITRNGKALYLDANGNIVDADGNIISFGGERLTSPGSRERELADSRAAAQDYAPAPELDPRRRPLVKPVTDGQSVSSEPQPANRNTLSEADLNPLDPTLSLIDPSDPEQRKKLAERYEEIQKRVSEQFDELIASWTEPAAAEFVTISTTVAPPMGGGGGADTAVTAGASPGASDSGANSASEGTPIASAFDTVYSVVRFNSQTDVSETAFLTVQSPGPLYGARCKATMERKEDYVVLTVNGGRLPDGRTLSFDAVAVDVNTQLPAMASAVDRHVVYRWGGLIGGKVLEGVSQAVLATAGSQTQDTAGGTAIVNPGLDPNYLLAASVGPAGEAIAASTIKQFNRDPTVWLFQGQELQLVFLSDVTVSGPARQTSEPVTPQ